MLAASPVTLSQESSGVVLENVIVTAQKREENLQDVPVSITALGTEKLEDLHIADFDDYAKFMPSLSYQGFGPGFARVFFRGVSSGDNGNHSGSQPTVGQYLDEQPITTIQGALDVHIYDVARVEALAGPQGTLYGASSQAGTIRIITNKPDTEKFSAGYDIEGNVLDGETGYVVEGFANVPLGDKAAIRLVGWSKHDAGYISNVEADREYPTAG
ncbi:MAG: TonB-dependent receptor plug domain-containing protein, partial [Steroidobacteraceae bacterium]